MLPLLPFLCKFKIPGKEEKNHKLFWHLNFGEKELKLLIWIMSQFNLEQQLQQALRLDSNITFNSSMNRSRATAKTPAGGNSKRQAQSTGRTGANSSLLNNSLNRSRVLGVQQPAQAQTNGINRSISTGRLGVSPGRNGNRNRSSSAGRGSIGGDRFIPNRSTTDLEQAHHSLVNTNDNLLSSDSSENLTEHQRLQLAQQTAEILNVSSKKFLKDF